MHQKLRFRFGCRPDGKTKCVVKKEQCFSRDNLTGLRSYVFKETTSQTVTQFIASITTAPGISNTLIPTNTGDIIQTIDFELTLNMTYNAQLANNNSAEFISLFNYLQKSIQTSSEQNNNFVLHIFKLLSVKSGSLIAEIELSLITKSIFSRCSMKSSFNSIIRNSFTNVLDLFIRNINTPIVVVSTTSPSSLTTTASRSSIVTSNVTTIASLKLNATSKSGTNKQIFQWLLVLMLYFIIISND